MKFLKSILSLALVASIVFSCNKDDDCKETYDGNVKAIIDVSCAYSGCHSGDDAGMWVPDGSKDYTNYTGMLNNLNNGLFKERTLDSLNMPDPMWTPDGHPKYLSEEELEILSCWVENGHPEN